MTVRLSKTLLVFLTGLYFLLVGIDNILAYDNNFEFVRHVLLMDTTYPNNPLMWRAVTDPSLHHAAYWIIIAAELLAGALCVLGAWRLYRERHAEADDFNQAKTAAVAGLVLGFALFFFGFNTIGAEWFQMWQSPVWNAQQESFRALASVGIVLIFLSFRDSELT